MPPRHVQNINLTVTHTGCNSSVTPISAKGPVQIETPTPVDPTEDSATEPETEEDWLALQASMLKQLKAKRKKTARESPTRSPCASASTSIRGSYKRERCSLISVNRLVVLSMKF
jgi:hypothetical protein